jgi:biotin carboxyl carrier protein
MVAGLKSALLGVKMRTIVSRWSIHRAVAAAALVPLALVMVACGGGSGSEALSDDLKKDLAASAASPVELANAGGAYQPMRFVSEIEQSNGAAPVQRTRAPRRVAAQRANVQQPEETQSPAAEPQQEVQVAEVPAEVQRAPAPEPDVPRVPTVAPRPSALPVDVPSAPASGGFGRDGQGGAGGIGVGRGDGVGIGDVIGVVIRGGGVGPDHCPPRRRGRPRFPILP